MSKQLNRPEEMPDDPKGLVDKLPTLDTRPTQEKVRQVIDVEELLASPAPKPPIGRMKLPDPTLIDPETAFESEETGGLFDSCPEHAVLGNTKKTKPPHQEPPTIPQSPSPKLQTRRKITHPRSLAARMTQEEPSRVRKLLKWLSDLF